MTIKEDDFIQAKTGLRITEHVLYSIVRALIAIVDEEGTSYGYDAEIKFAEQIMYEIEKNNGGSKYGSTETKEATK